MVGSNRLRPLWQLPFMMATLGCAALILNWLLPHVLDFSLAVSSAWQVVLHHLAIAVLVSLSFSVFFSGPSAPLRRVRVFMVVAAVGAPSLLFLHAWVRLGWFDGYRDPLFVGHLYFMAALIILLWSLPAFLSLTAAGFRSFRPGSRAA